MGAGANAGSFGAGLAKGLARSYREGQERKRDDARRAEERQDRLRSLEISTMLPILLENAEDVADIEPWLQERLPGQFKGTKGKQNLAAIKPFLSPMVAGRTAAGAPQQSSGVVGGVLDAQQVTPAAVGAPNAKGATATPHGKAVWSDLDTGDVLGEAPAIAPTRRTMMGVPILSTSEKATRDVDLGIEKLDADVSAKVDLARRMLPKLQAADPTATMDDALAAVGIRTPSATARSAAAMRPSSVRGVLANGSPAFGVFDPTTRSYINPNTQQPYTAEDGFTPLTAQATQTFGSDRESIAMTKFGQPFRQLDQAQQSQVLVDEQTMITEKAKSRGVGTGQAAFEKPVDLKTSQDTGAAVGTNASQFAGQVVPTEQQQARLRNAVSIKQQLGGIIGLDPVTGAIDPSKSLLKALPSQNELQGLLPGAANWTRRRLPQYRNDYATLESSINNIRAALTRTMQSNVGTETEKDAQRALSTLADFEGAITDPAKGDTRESAMRRFQETLAYLDSVMAVLPQMPRPNVPGAAPGQSSQPGAVAPPQAAPAVPAAAPVTPPAGRATTYKDANGNWQIRVPAAPAPAR